MYMGIGVFGVNGGVAGTGFWLLQVEFLQCFFFSLRVRCKRCGKLGVMGSALHRSLVGWMDGEGCFSRQ